MNKFFLVLALMLGISVGAQAEEMSPKQAAEYLNQSIVQLSRSPHGESYCTAWKVADAIYATAGHCTSRNQDMYINDGEFDWARVKAFTIGVGNKKSNDAPADWALLYTTKDLEDIVQLPLACSNDLYIGMSVSHMGYGHPTSPSLHYGYVSSLNIEKHRGDAEVLLSTHVSGGASGSPVIDNTTGSVIGIVTEFVPSARVGVIGTGMEGIVEGVCEASKPHLQTS